MDHVDANAPDAADALDAADAPDAPDVANLADVDESIPVRCLRIRCLA